MGAVLSLAQTHLLLFRVDSAQAQFPSAIAHYQRYKVLTDSVFNERKTKQLASLEIQYDTKKKEQNIALLTKQTQMQQASLREREFQRNVLLGGAVLLALLLCMGYSRYRLKQRSNQLLEAQQAEINRQNASLQHLLTEKDWMLKEIHHRVKNNLEVISSLLETQSDYLRDPSALIALREGQNRVHAMGLIHQKLYQSHSLSVVDMAAYIREIAEHLVESFDCQDTVQLHLNVVPIELEVTLATPLGLIINEALTNALKYAWPRPQPGNIRIGLMEMAAQHLQLVIEDDGAGFPAGFDMEDGRTMGLTIMRGLSGQLDGRLRIIQTPGVRVSLEFEVATSAVPARIEQ
jgi:two-component sensor histidine kinase